MIWLSDWLSAYCLMAFGCHLITITIRLTKISHSADDGNSAGPSGFRSTPQNQTVKNSNELVITIRLLSDYYQIIIWLPSDYYHDVTDEGLSLGRWWQERWPKWISLKQRSATFRTRLLITDCLLSVTVWFLSNYVNVWFLSNCWLIVKCWLSDYYLIAVWLLSQMMVTALAQMDLAEVTLRDISQ